MKIGDPAPAWSHDAEKYNCRECGLEAWYAGVYPDDPDDDLCPDCYQELEDDGIRYSPCTDCHASVVSECRVSSGEIVRAGTPLYCHNCAHDHAEYLLSYTDRMRSSPQHGYVYLVDSRAGYWKIGRSAVPVQRIGMLEVKLPYDLEVIALIETKNMYVLESRLHKKYAAKRAKGEWFRLTPEDIAFIKSLVPIPKWRRKVSDLMNAGEHESWR